jgi:hypothetical protein
MAILSLFISMGTARIGLSDPRTDVAIGNWFDWEISGKV